VDTGVRALGGSGRALMRSSGAGADREGGLGSHFRDVGGAEAVAALVPTGTLELGGSEESLSE